MIETFITPEMLQDYTLLVTIVFVIVQFTKELGFLKRVPTRLYAACISFLIILYSNILFNNFEPSHLPLYAFTAIIISATSNGIYDLAKKG